MVGRNGEKRMGGEEEESNVDQAVVRAGYRSLMDDITNNEEELGDVSGVCHTQLKEYMEANEALFQQVKIYLKTDIAFLSSHIPPFRCQLLKRRCLTLEC